MDNAVQSLTQDTLEYMGEPFGIQTNDYGNDIVHNYTSDFTFKHLLRTKVLDRIIGTPEL